MRYLGMRFLRKIECWLRQGHDSTFVVLECTVYHDSAYVVRMFTCRRCGRKFVKTGSVPMLRSTTMTTRNPQ